MMVCPTTEERLNVYAGGELDVGSQATLFAHLAACEDCRTYLERVMSFRRLLREERIRVPPRGDIQLFERIAEIRRANMRSDRLHDPDPVWGARGTISLKTGLAVASVVFVCGLLFGSLTSADPAYSVVGDQEAVAFDPGVASADAVYVFYPGLTIEADRLDP